jgi:hypothetical protein
MSRQFGEQGSRLKFIYLMLSAGSIIISKHLTLTALCEYLKYDFT